MGSLSCEPVQAQQVLWDSLDEDSGISLSGGEGK